MLYGGSRATEGRAIHVYMVSEIGGYTMSDYLVVPVMLRLHIHGLTHKHDTVKCSYHVLVDRFMFISLPCHVRVGLQGQICPCQLFWDSQNNWHRQMSVSNPYRLRVMSALHPCCPCHIRIASVAHPQCEFTHGYCKDVTRKRHGRRTDAIQTNVDWDGQIIMAVDSIWMWCEFDTHLMWTKRMQHGCDTDVTWIKPGYSYCGAVEGGLKISVTETLQCHHMRIWCLKSPVSWLFNNFKFNIKHYVKDYVFLVICEGNTLVTSGFPTQRASYTESVSVSWFTTIAIWHLWM